MKTSALRKIDLAVLVALSLIALAVVTLGARLVHGQASSVSDLGPGWKCHTAPFFKVCNRIG
jgi:hypothetical protein